MHHSPNIYGPRVAKFLRNILKNHFKKLYIYIYISPVPYGAAFEYRIGFSCFGPAHFKEAPFAKRNKQPIRIRYAQPQVCNMFFSGMNICFQSSAFLVHFRKCIRCLMWFHIFEFRVLLCWFWPFDCREPS